MDGKHFKEKEGRVARSGCCVNRTQAPAGGSCSKGVVLFCFFANDPYHTKQGTKLGKFIGSKTIVKVIFDSFFGAEKPFVKLRPAYSVKLVFSYVVKGIKVKITARFRASRRLRSEDKKIIMSPEMRPKSFGTFEKRDPGVIVGSLLTLDSHHFYHQLNLALA